MKQYFKCLLIQNITAVKKKMLFKTLIMFLNDQFILTILTYKLSYSITNLLGFIGFTLTFISGILRIKANSIEIMKQL